MTASKDEATIGILTVSDRAYSGAYEDESGPAIRTWLDDVLSTPWRGIYRIVPDEQERIEAALRELADREGCSLVLTTGGTGPAPRDVTPEALEAVCSKILPGFGEEMRRASLKVVPTAILSRQEAGIRGQSLIITLPGNPPAIADSLEAVFPAVPYAVDLIGGGWVDTRPERMTAFRPKHARRPEQ
ncbi:MAG: molybdopterin adenylyltransferase [Spirochaetaceae bacterium]